MKIRFCIVYICAASTHLERTYFLLTIAIGMKREGESNAYSVCTYE